MNDAASGFGVAASDLYRELMAVSREPLLLIGCAERKILDLNLAACQLYGMARAQLIDSPYTTFFTEARFLEDILDEHRDFVPLRYQRDGHGRHFPVEMSLRYLDSAQGEVAVISLRDVSERLTRDRHANENERKYRALFEASPYPILMLSMQGLVADANRCAHLQYAYEEGELSGCEWAVIDGSGNMPQFSVRPTVLPTTGHRRKDGSTFMAEVVLSYFRLHGQPMILAVIRDVTEHWNTFQQLQASEARWRFAIEGHGEALIDWPLESNEDDYYISPVLSRALGYDEQADRAVPMTVWHARLHPDDREIIEWAIRNYLDSGVPNLQVEFRLRESTSDYRWFSLHGKSVGGQGGRPRRLVGAISDIHLSRERKLQEVADKDRLYRLERLAAVGEMLSALAHEVNQPLTVIANYSAVAMRQLARDLGKEDVGKSLGVINGQALRAGEILRRIRDFVRRGDPSCQPTNLNQLIQKVVGWLEQQLLSAGIFIQLDLDISLPDLPLDVLQIEQVVLNLLRNAIEAMEDNLLSKPRKIVVSTLHAGENVEVCIRDYGHGLPESTACDMFDPFVTSKKDGMGMGLAICRTVIESHGGRLWAESVSGERGTRFIFTLAVRPQPAQ